MARKPPDHLSPRSKALWRELVRARCDSTERQVLLQAALEDLDRIDQARTTIAAEGATFRTATTGAIHAHPATKLEAEARRRFLAVWRALDLTWPGD